MISKSKINIHSASTCARSVAGHHRLFLSVKQMWFPSAQVKLGKCIEKDGSRKVVDKLNSVSFN